MTNNKIISQRQYDSSTEIITYADGQEKQRKQWNFKLKNLDYNRYTLVQVRGMIYFIPASPIETGWSITILRQWLFEEECWYDSVPARHPSENIKITERYILIFYPDGRIAFKLKHSTDNSASRDALLECLKEF